MNIIQSESSTALQIEVTVEESQEGFKIIDVYLRQYPTFDMLTGKYYPKTKTSNVNEDIRYDIIRLLTGEVKINVETYKLPA